MLEGIPRPEPASYLHFQERKTMEIVELAQNVNSLNLQSDKDENKQREGADHKTKNAISLRFSLF